MKTLIFIGFLLVGGAGFEPATCALRGGVRLFSLRDPLAAFVVVWASLMPDCVPEYVEHGSNYVIDGSVQKVDDYLGQINHIVIKRLITLLRPIELQVLAANSEQREIAINRRRDTQVTEHIRVSRNGLSERTFERKYALELMLLHAS